MSDIKVFRLEDQDINLSNPIVTVPVVNAGFSRSMGAGFAAFEACSVEHTVTGYDENLYVRSGSTRKTDKFSSGDPETIDNDE